MIRDLYIDYPDFLILATNWFEIISGKDFFEAEIDDHAGESETSVMMYYHPELVKLNEAGNGEVKNFAIPSLNKKIAWTPRHWDKASTDSGIGDPRKASVEKGRDYAHAVIEKLADLFIDITKHKYINPYLISLFCLNMKVRLFFLVITSGKIPLTIFFESTFGL